MDCEYLHGRIQQVLPYIYSGIALALWNVLDEPEEEKERDVMTLIQESQNIWNQAVEDGKDIIELCKEVTGIDVRPELE